MSYQPKNFDHLLGTQGFSDVMLKNHFTLYQGYVTNMNKLLDELETLYGSDKAGTPAWAEIKRRLGWEYNGMRLHELYFGNMQKNAVALDQNSELAKKLAKQYPSLELWKKAFMTTGAMRGIGWTILYYDPEDKRFFNVWVNEHDVGHFAGCTPLLVLDVFEHAYVLDYGLKRADYIEAFMKAVDWGVVGERFGKIL